MAKDHEQKCFKHIAKLVKSKRVNHPHQYSQTDLSNILGYKNGQFISNVERGLCGVPYKKLSKLCKTLSITKDEAMVAMVLDLETEALKHLGDIR